MPRAAHGEDTGAAPRPEPVREPIREPVPEPVHEPAAGSGPGPAMDPVGDPVRDPWRAPMRYALAEADLAALAGDVPVGAVVLAPDGSVLATGHNEREATGDPTAHAEVLALRRAAAATGEWRLTGCTLVVTLEPCVMCAGALVQARVERVVFGAFDEKAGATGSLWDLVRDRRLNHRPEVIHGVLEAECSAQLTAFFRTR
ncbi:cytidine and deoxycytidylate deaminase family protein [Streptomyces laurentii]|uniref:tRNA-specific adenosine deaminase n=3 Tax=Streptomyces laurentii TaxID=39478 RepID=A0A160P2V2_STRLU|nr:cytidine and deoxycytidylate deaminase family protein [Streptomyces laurentii]